MCLLKSSSVIDSIAIIYNFWMPLVHKGDSLVLLIQVCAKVLPSVMPCLIDPSSGAVRNAGFACVETYLGKLKEVSARLRVEEEERRRVEVFL